MSVVILIFCLVGVINAYTVYNPQNNPYGYPSGYPSSYPRSYGNYQQHGSSCLRQSYSFCQHLPCYSQNSQVRPYQQQYNRRYPFSPIVQSNQNVQNIQQLVQQQQRPAYQVQPSQQVTNQQYPNQQDEYSNVPVEIVDEEDYSKFSQNRGKKPQAQDEYANVPTEIIDEEEYNRLLQDNAIINPTSASTAPPEDNYISYYNPPEEYRPRSFSSSSNYSVQSPNLTTSYTQKNKPIDVTVSRTYNPQQQQEPIRLDFYNGEPVNEDGGVSYGQDLPNEEEEEEQEVARVTTTELSNAVEGNENEEDEEKPQSVSSWFD